eukprot:scaffold663_cov341-Pavlova_lutheri.AAC.10
MVPLFGSVGSDGGDPRWVRLFFRFSWGRTPRFLSFLPFSSVLGDGTYPGGSDGVVSIPFETADQTSQPPPLAFRNLRTTMGRCPNHHTKGKRSGARDTNKTSRREVFLRPHADQVFKKYHGKKETVGKNMPYDENLPGMGQFYCIPTGRYFENEAALMDHMKTKEFKRTLKRLEREGKPHDRRDAEKAAGMGKPDHGTAVSRMDAEVTPAEGMEALPFDL